MADQVTRRCERCYDPVPPTVGGRFCRNCRDYLAMLDRGYHRVFHWLYESERDGRERLRGRQAQFELPELVYYPPILETLETHRPPPPLGAVSDRVLYATRVVYDLREEYLNKRLYRRYYVRRPDESERVQSGADQRGQGDKQGE